ncbi:G-protein-signaling modulator 2 [Culicoides brevitarsis]|uniref:G-protein-signaling modulator 2 n=1 Tax=Culicoides brevitarsis TaxID=469753 RepID=UPI00307BFD67
MALSTSLSAENLTGNNETSSDTSSMCLELALEGERLCKSGDCRAGVAFFQAAISSGTNDLRTLSAIYSQLGNAYFYLGDYQKAMQYHKLDLTLARSMDDRLGEAKSSGNLGNTLKVMGRFEEAVICCERHLKIATELGDKLSEGRALYNLGNVYHAKGKELRQKDDSSGEFSDEIKAALNKAIEYYQKNLTLMRELGDLAAQGRACGNLGNTYYLLGNFEQAIEHHKERLKIAREFGDKPAERRANSNLGNSYIFLGEFEIAAEHYKKTLSLAIDLGEQAVEAQACYSLGNTFTLLRDFPAAIQYHQRHLAIAQELGDRIGEARAYWSLGNAHAAVADNDKALHYAQLHYVLAKEIGDLKGEETAKMNIGDLRRVMGLPEMSDSDSLPEIPNHDNQSNGSRQIRVRRQSMEQLDLIKLTPDAKQAAKLQQQQQQQQELNGEETENVNSDLFDMLTKFQSKRMDDQRCTLKVNGTTNGDSRKPLAPQNTPKTTFIDMIANFQSERMDEQRAALPGLRSPAAVTPSHNHQPADAPASAPENNGSAPSSQNNETSEDFLDLLARCQGSRIEDQRSELPTPGVTMDTEADANETQPTPARNPRVPASTIDEDFFSLIMKVQSGRMDDQRASVPSTKKFAK